MIIKMHTYLLKKLQQFLDTVIMMHKKEQMKEVKT